MRTTAPFSLEHSLRSDIALFDEDHHSLTKRLERFGTEHAWAEDPPSRTRRFVSNVMVYGESPTELIVRSYILLYRSRGDTSPADLVSAERRDVLRAEDEQLLLEERLVLVDDAVLHIMSLSTIL